MYDCKCLSERRRTRERERGDREIPRQRCCVVAVYRVSYLARGLHSFRSQPPLRHPPSAAQPHLLQLAVDPASSKSLQNRLK